MRRTRWARGVAMAAVVSLTAVACSDDDDSSAPASASAADSAPTTIGAPAAFDGHGSVGQAYALGAEPGDRLVVHNAAGEVMGAREVNDVGGVVVRGLDPGPGYTFRSDGGNGRVAVSAPFEVLAPDDHPDAAFYERQVLGEGLNYITTRDGVEITATVRLPPGTGPFPTVVEYSGYAISAPGDPLNPDDELRPSGALGAALAPLFGYASVMVQMRGTGCSGGAFGVLDTVNALDGYDAIETVAAQDWVKGGTVGMIGTSFAGMSQMLVAGTQPPHLAAIAPMSITDDLYSTGVTGGMVNYGQLDFWLRDRLEEAKPADQGGQEWARIMIEQGDGRCAANQALHSFAVTPDELFAGPSSELQDRYGQAIPATWNEAFATLVNKDAAVVDIPRVGDAADERAPEDWADDIEVPTFLVGAVQDEATGPQWANVIPALDDHEEVWITLLNGTHVDPLGPGTLTRWAEFLDFFVNGDTGVASAAVPGLAPLLYNVRNLPAGEVPVSRFAEPGQVEAARAQFASDPRIRVLFDNGGRAAAPGAMDPMWEAGFDAWPASNATATAYHLGANGSLTTTEPQPASDVSYRPDPTARPATTLQVDRTTRPAVLWAAAPAYDWRPVRGDSGLGFVTEPLADDLVLVGPASIDLSLESTAEDTDLQVTLSEVRPDGQEMYIQTGFLRASHRALDEARSTELIAAPTFAPDDVRALPRGTATSVRVPFGPLTHAVRAGSRLRVTITAPGGDRPIWAFVTYQTDGQVTNTVHLGGDQPSTVMLPVVSGVEPGGPPPPCPSLRGQPCRPYEPAGNGG
jgi:uncharacterized protein